MHVPEWRSFDLVRRHEDAGARIAKRAVLRRRGRDGIYDAGRSGGMKSSTSKRSKRAVFDDRHIPSPATKPVKTTLAAIRKAIRSVREEPGRAVKG